MLFARATMETPSPAAGGAGEKYDGSVETAIGAVSLRAGPFATYHGGEGVIAAWSNDAVNARCPRPDRNEVRAGAFLRADAAGLEISRGPYGGRALYYAAFAHGWLASSTMCELLQALPAVPSFDFDRLASLAAGLPPLEPTATPYVGVRRVLPCETIAFRPGGPRGWFEVPRLASRLPPDVPGHARALQEALDAVVVRKLAPFSKVAVSTGGGVDSGALLALVAREAGRRKLDYAAVALDFAGPGDDRPYLATLLETLDASALRLTPGKADRIPLSMFTQDALPLIWPSSPADILARRLARSWGAEATVSGLGGDQILDGDDAVYARRARDGDARALLDAMRLRVAYASSPGERLLELIAKPILRSFVPESVRVARRKKARRRSEPARWAGARLRRQLAIDRGEARTADADWLTKYALSHSMMDVADTRGQADQASGIPQLEPYLDPEFIDLVCSFPPAELFYGDRTRGLFREGMRGFLPESLRLRADKAGFEPLVAGTFQDFGGFEGLASLLTMEASADAGIVEPRPFREAFVRIARGERTELGWLDVWPALAVEGFLRSPAPSLAKGERS